jgi:importin-7
VLQQGQPHLYENLTKVLGPEEQQVIQAAINQADQISALQASAAQQQLQANGEQHP